MSDAVVRFERAFADWLGAGRAFAFWKGRVALYAILKALGVGEGDEVILPGYTCVVAVNPVLYLGAVPVYVDVDPATYNVRPDLMETAVTPRTRVLVAQHTYGYPADMDPILDLGRRHGLPVVEDSCLAFGSTYKSRVCGTMAPMSYFSFQWNKTATTGIGGLAIAQDEGLATEIERLRRDEALDPSTKEAALLAAQRLVHRAFVYPKTILAIQALFRWLVDHRLLVGSSATEEYRRKVDPAFFKRMGAGQARAGVRAVSRLEANLAHRRRMAALYNEMLSERGWPRPALPEGIDPVLVRYPVRVADKARALALARERRVELGDWYECPLHQVLVSLEEYGYREGMCPEAERAAREVVNLPTHPRAREKHAREAVDLVCEIGPAS